MSKEYPLNVLIIDQGLEFGGSIVSTSNLIRGINKAKYNVVFMSSANKSIVKSKLREEKETATLLINRKVIHYNSMHLLMNPFSQSGGKILVFIKYLIRLLLNSIYMARIVFAILRYKIDIVQHNNGIDDETALAAMLTKRKQVVYFRGYTKLGQLQRSIYLKKIQHFFSVSTYIKNVAISDGIGADKITVLTPPVIAEETNREKQEKIRLKYKLDDDVKLVGIFGRIIAWKGQKEFLHAAKNILAKESKVRFFIIGEATDNEQKYAMELRNYIEKENLEEMVFFTGYIDNVYDYYDLMDVVVHASIEGEPSGRVIFESMSQGTPVVASVFGGAKEFIDHNVDGCIVDPTDVDDLSGAIMKLLKDDELADLFGKRAREKMRQQYNKDIYARRIESIYSEVMGVSE